MPATVASLALILLSGVSSAVADASSQTVQARDTCLQASIPSFTINVVYKQAPPSGPASVAVKTIDVHTVPHIGYSILSTCPTCPSSWPSYVLANGALQPVATTPTKTTSFALVAGESPSFVSTQFLPQGYKGYCTVASPNSESTAPVLAANADSSLWALCANSTAMGRVDVVWSPKATHAHYVKSTCQEVYLQLV